MKDDLLKNVVAGQPVSAENTNRMIDRVRQVTTGPYEYASAHGPTSNRRPPSRMYDSNLILVTNNAEDAEPFSVLGLDRFSTSPNDFTLFADWPLRMEGIVPDENEHLGKFCVTQEFISTGGQGIALAGGGITPVRVEYHESIADGLYSWHDFADVEHGEIDRLHSCICGGARIIGVDTDDSEAIKWVYVRLL